MIEPILPSAITKTAYENIINFSMKVYIHSKNKHGKDYKLQIIPLEKEKITIRSEKGRVVMGINIAEIEEYPKKYDDRFDNVVGCLVELLKNGSVHTADQVSSSWIGEVKVIKEKAIITCNYCGTIFDDPAEIAEIINDGICPDCDEDIDVTEYNDETEDEYDDAFEQMMQNKKFYCDVCGQEGEYERELCTKCGNYNTFKSEDVTLARPTTTITEWKTLISDGEIWIQVVTGDELLNFRQLLDEMKTNPLKDAYGEELDSLKGVGNELVYKYKQLANQEEAFILYNNVKMDEVDSDDIVVGRIDGSNDIIISGSKLISGTVGDIAAQISEMVDIGTSELHPLTEDDEGLVEAIMFAINE